MIKKLQSTIQTNRPAIAAIVILLLVWELICVTGLVPGYMLPSPTDVLKAFAGDATILWQNALVTLQEAIYGLLFGILLGFIIAVLMDMFDVLYKALYPILVISQTIPAVAIAPLLVLWFGYEMKPKIILVVISSFFPLTVGLLQGFRSVDEDSINMLKTMGAGQLKIFRYIKLPSSLPQFFSGLRIAAAYSVVGAVISEWLGGFSGLGVYMTRVKKAYAFDKMFAVIILISLVSLLLMLVIEILEKTAMPYLRITQEE